MTIQISVTIWTVICFILLALILHFLLFKPVLGVMDSRKAKLEKARQNKEDYQEKIKQYELTLAEKKAAFEIESKKMLEEELEKVQADGKAAVISAQEERISQVEDFRNKTQAEHQEIMDVLCTHTDLIAKSLVDNIIKE